MYTSDNKTIRHCLGHIFAAVFLAVFGAIYEYFSHEVYSFFMIYAFAIPLLFGAVPYGILAGKENAISDLARSLWNCAIATFSVGCLFKGALDIYGTTNRLIIVYPVVGTLLGVSAVISFVIYKHQSRNTLQSEA